MSEVSEATQESLVRELGRKPQSKGIIDYITVLKPRETVLLAFIGVCSAIIAAQGGPHPGVIALVLVTVAIGSAGANGLTNYLDRDVDARMKRTHMRALPCRADRPCQEGSGVERILNYGSIDISLVS